MGVCQPLFLSIPFWIAIAILLGARRSLFYLIPVLIFAIFCGVVTSSWWHMGLLVPLLICLLWITWPTSGGKASLSEVIGSIALITIAAGQILWSAYAIEFDHYNAYSPDLAASEFLRPFVRQGATIAVTFMVVSMDDSGTGAFRSVGILPYFDHNIFINQPDSFWLWSSQNPSEEMFKEILPFHPTLVVVEEWTFLSDRSVNLLNPKIKLLESAGYRLTNMFCGVMPEGFQLREKGCHLIFQRVDNTRESSANKTIQASVAK
jgi:hypothetical protein